MSAPHPSLRARLAAVAGALALSALACTGQEQALGGSPTPAPDPVPTTWIRGQEECPWTKPSEGSPCGSFDEHDAAVAAQCRYHERAPDCTYVCVCGYNGGWSCFHSACGILTAEACAEGASCDEGVNCSSPTADCYCTDRTLRCLPHGP
jgi:hypothetical protein